MNNAELERLAILSEEMGEALQVIGKIIRHGYESTHPDGGPTNRDLLALELGDVMTATLLLLGSGDVSRLGVQLRVPLKLRKLQKYTHDQAALLEELIAQPEFIIEI
jgi:NTP pyrophosphatase (non-canonical NTP hydrolase)